MFLECVLATFILVYSVYVSFLGSSPDGLLDMTNDACPLQGALTEVAVLIKSVLMVLNPDGIY